MTSNDEETDEAENGETENGNKSTGFELLHTYTY